MGDPPSRTRPVAKLGVQQDSGTSSGRIKRIPSRSSALLLLLFAALAPLVFAPARAQESAPEPVHWSAKFKSAAPLRSGEKTSVSITAAIDPGWHVYAVDQPPESPISATRITVPDGQPLALAGNISWPEPVFRIDPTIGKPTDLYENFAAFVLPLSVSKKARPGKHSFEVEVRFQACDDRLCLPPRTEKIETSVRIASRR